MLIGHAATFLANVVPWPEPGWTDKPPFFVNIHWRSQRRDRDGNPMVDPAGKPLYWMPGRACTSVKEALNAVEWWLPKGVDLYVCMSAQCTAREKIGRNGRKYYNAIRGQNNVACLQDLWIDIDVKDKAFKTTEEAVEAFGVWRRKAELPPCSFVVGSGSGGFHAHWVLEQAVDFETWYRLSHGLVKLLHDGKMPIDYPISTDAARLLRIPETWNFKHDPPRPVSLWAAP